MTLRWSRLSLQTKVTVAVLVIVVLSMAIAIYLDRHDIASQAREDFQGEMLAVAHYIDAGIPSLADLHKRDLREAKIQELRSTRPELLQIELYELPADKASPPVLIARSGSTERPNPVRVAALLASVRESGAPVFDLRSEPSPDRLRIAAPIFVQGLVIGATYAEFSSHRLDQTLDYQLQLMLRHRLLIGALLVLTINLFLYWYVHRPVAALLKAVNAVSQGTMYAQVPVHGEDELGELADRFNKMVERIRAATGENRRLYDELQEAHQGLQRKVEQATAEILQKNRALARTNELLSTAQRETARAQRLSAIGQFAATVAHKIGTPLTALSGHVQLLEEDPHLSEEARQRLQTVAVQIERTSRIIQDLLLYARKPELALSPVDLNACLEECAALLRPEIERRNVALLLSLGSGLDTVAADQTQLQEVFCNLIENALDAMPHGGTLRIRSRRAEIWEQGKAVARVAAEIADSGSGIEPEYLEQIFQPFFTTKKAGRGTGLGLAIAYETVRAHGGRITVESEPGKGTTFSVLLPAATEAV